MSLIQETLFDLLLNALLQIGFFAIVAAVFSRLVARTRAKHQHTFYFAVLLFSVAAPAINTLWQIALNRSRREISAADSLGH